MIFILNRKVNSLFVFSLLFIFQIANAQPTEAGDWSAVRLYGHAYNINDFSAGEYEWIKDKYEYFTIEKRHARTVYGDISSERASVATATKIIANNNNAKPLFYWNTGPVYSEIYETIQEVLADNPDWVDADSGRWTFEDVEFRTWFVDVVKDMVNNHGHSGVFLDAVMTLQGHTSREAANYCLEMMDEMPGIVIYNGFAPVPTRIHAGLDYLEHADGVFVEHFFRAHCDSQDEGEFMLDALLQVPNDKIIIANSQPEDTFWETTDHKFSLAAFLIIANENSYYHYFSTELYSSEYMTYWHSDFEQEIGEPLGTATKNGYVYTRSFKNANVMVDLENKTSSIEWLANTLSIDSNELENSEIGFSVYPNPVLSEFSISNNSMIQKIEVFNVLGDKVKEFENIEEGYIIKELASGVYFVKLTSFTGIVNVKRLIKE